MVIFYGLEIGNVEEIVIEFEDMVWRLYFYIRMDEMDSFKLVG